MFLFFFIFFSGVVFILIGYFVFVVRVSSLLRVWLRVGWRRGEICFCFIEFYF